MTETFQKAGEGGAVLPGLEMESLETFGELRIGQQGLARQIRARADEWNFQIVGQEPQRVEKDALLPVGAGQHAVDLIKDDHAGANSAKQRPTDVLLAARVPVAIAGASKLASSSR